MLTRSELEGAARNSDLHGRLFVGGGGAGHQEPKAADENLGASGSQHQLTYRAQLDLEGASCTKSQDVICFRETPYLTFRMLSAARSGKPTDIS